MWTTELPKESGAYHFKDAASGIVEIVNWDADDQFMERFGIDFPFTPQAQNAHKRIEGQFWDKPIPSPQGSSVKTKEKQKKQNLHDQYADKLSYQKDELVAHLTKYLEACLADLKGSPLPHPSIEEFVNPERKALSHFGYLFLNKLHFTPHRQTRDAAKKASVLGHRLDYHIIASQDLAQASTLSHSIMKKEVLETSAQAQNAKTPGCCAACAHFNEGQCIKHQAAVLQSDHCADYQPSAKSA